MNGENLRINLAHAAAIHRVLVFAYIEEGAARFDEAHGVVTLHPQGGGQIEVLLDETAGDNTMCAVALIESVDGEFTVRREVRFLHGSQRALDTAYAWGMQWRTGHK